MSTRWFLSLCQASIEEKQQFCHLDSEGCYSYWDEAGLKTDISTSKVLIDVTFVLG